jgi:hypothetical protein
LICSQSFAGRPGESFEVLRIDAVLGAVLLQRGIGCGEISFRQCGADVFDDAGGGEAREQEQDGESTEMHGSMMPGSGKKFQWGKDVSQSLFFRYFYSQRKCDGVTDPTTVALTTYWISQELG